MEADAVQLELVRAGVRPEEICDLEGLQPGQDRSDADVLADGRADQVGAWRGMSKRFEERLGAIEVTAIKQIDEGGPGEAYELG